MVVEHLSYSSISTYQQCPRAWKFRYIEKVPSAPSPAMTFGGAFHNTIESYLKVGGSLLHHWERELPEKINSDSAALGAEDQHQLYEEGKRMFSHPEVQQGLAQIKPMRIGNRLMIETKVEMQVEGVPVPIIGYVDLIEEDSIPADFKTSRGSWNDTKGEAELQPLFYLSALNQQGIQVPGWKFRHYVFVKTKNPQFQKIESAFHPQQQIWLEGMIRHVWHAIESGVFFENPSSWKCGAANCEYWSLCRGKYLSE